MDVLESHSGADTMPAQCQHTSRTQQLVPQPPTLLSKDVQTLLDQQRSVEDDEAVAERQHIVTRPHFEKGPDGALRSHEQSISLTFSAKLHQTFRLVGRAPHCATQLTRPSICSRSSGECIGAGFLVTGLEPVGEAMLATLAAGAARDTSRR